MNYRLIHNNEQVLTIMEAFGETCSNGNEIVDGTIDEIYQLISDLSLTNTIPMSAFEQ